MDRLITGAVLFSCFRIVTARTDCSLSYPSSDSGSISTCFFSGTYGVNFYCVYPYTCCSGSVNGCCFSGAWSQWFTPVELIGIILNATAMFFVCFLSLIICGATYCNAKEDASHLFMANRK